MDGVGGDFLCAVGLGDRDWACVSVAWVLVCVSWVAGVTTGGWSLWAPAVDPLGDSVLSGDCVAG
jgi:hypothetical protein